MKVYPHAQALAAKLAADIPAMMAVCDVDGIAAGKGDAVGEGVLSVGHAATVAVMIEDGRNQLALGGHEANDGHSTQDVMRFQCVDDRQDQIFRKASDLNQAASS